MSIKIIAEIGINHNGSLEITKKLIDIASVAGCDYVKFQKRNPDVCVPNDQKNVMRDTIWGQMTYLEYKNKMEFTKDQYKEIDDYCKTKNIGWFASVWDLDSAIFMSMLNCKIVKVPSAKLTSSELLKYCRKNFETLLLSTGMSTEEEIETAVHIGDPDVIFHTNSVYPSPIEDLKLKYILWLKDKYPTREIGYSNHYFGLIPSIACTLYDVKWIEFHITLDRFMWGSDQLSSVEPNGVFKLVKGIRGLEIALTGYEARKLYPGEELKLNQLRGKK